MNMRGLEGWRARDKGGRRLSLWCWGAVVWLGLVAGLASVEARELKAFRWQSLRPYLAGKALRPLRRALERNACSRAEALRKRAKMTRSQKRAALVLVGRCWMTRRQWAKSRRALQRANAPRFVLRDYLHLWIGDTWREENKNQEAVASYLKVGRDSLLYSQARLRSAEMLLEVHKPKAALASIQKMPSSQTGAAHWWVAARAAHALGTKKGRREATRWAMRIWVKEPASGEAASVKTWWRRRKLWLRPSKAQRIARAMKLNRHYLYRMALRTLRRVRLSRKAPKKWRCRLHYARGFAWFRRRRYRRAIPYLKRARLACRGDSRLDIRTLYYLGNAYRRRGRWRGGAVYLREMAKRFPKHYLADDGIFMIADSADRRGLKRMAKKTYSELMRRFPEGDMSFVARWRLAYQAYRYRQWKRAIRRFRAIYQSYPKSRYAPGALYYAARATQRWKGRRGRRKAVALYRDLVDRYPLHYYSFLALSQLRRLTRRSWLLSRCRWSQSAEGLRCVPIKRKRKRRRRVRVLPWGPLPTRPPTTNELLRLFDGQRAPYLTDARYRRGRALFRLGLRSEAAAEWWKLATCRAFGLTRKSRRWRCGRRGDTGAELLGLHFHLAGLYHLADRVYRGRGKIAGRLSFHHETLRSWYLAYPRPFYPVVKAAVRRDKVDPYAVYGIMREESTFRPNIQSRSNAYGLMQLLLSTARRAARTLRIRNNVQPADLFKPEINIPIGVRHLRFLHKQFRGQLALMAGAYNAGSGRVKRWLKRYGRYAYDKWVEAIPIKQTRHYVRRVSQSYSVYHFLYSPARRQYWKPAPFAPYRAPKR